jgi:hypothetical protein
VGGSRSDEGEDLITLFRHLVAPDYQLRRAHDVGRVAAYGGAVLVKDGVLVAEVFGTAGGAVPNVSMLGYDPEREPFPSGADQHGRPGALEGLGLAHGPP